ncbi:vomeronasal type-1 receptor 4-like [Microtus pennsylvanicus]|uniref:vomeronasal type-1 receptor 4-like n=1 Tax=Microtus pennsylvanicus TaxID=10058 RepID=UPI003F6B9E45
MDLKNFAIIIIFLTQSTFGILGNISLLSKYLIIYYNEHTLKPTDLILTHLITANFLIILSKGVPHTMAAFGMKLFFSDFMCKLFLYIQRLGRSMSMGTTCLLSVYQAITISPHNSFWKNIKFKFPNHIGFTISFCWALYSAINFIFPVLVHIKQSQKNTTEKRDFSFCSALGREKIVELLYIALLVFPEVLFSLFIIWSSGSMIAILHRHKQLIQYIRRNQTSIRISPESRATQSILILVTTFIVFYTLSSILQGFIAVLYKANWWLVIFTSFISMCFPTLCPFLMSHDFILLRFCLF